MDVFSLLKFWRNAGVGDPITADVSDDEGSFFDLVFTNPNSLNDSNHCIIDSPSVHVISDFHTHHHHFSKINGSDLNSNRTYPKSPRSIFFNHKTKISPLDSSSSNNSKTPRSPFRVLMLGLHNNNNNNNKSSKLDKKEMKCEVQEVTISSFLKRDNSLRNKLRSEKLHDSNLNDNEEMHSKRFSKEVVHKYLNLIKPLYVRVSKRSTDKVQLSSAQVTASFYSPIKEEKPLGKTVLKEMRKHLGKSRSSSSASVTVKPIPSTVLRRDDSALQQQDGIQSAILHCKKSYISPSQGCNVLSRSGSAPSHGARISVDEEKRTSI